jgi:hypothetical protein
MMNGDASNKTDLTLQAALEKATALRVKTEVTTPSVTINYTESQVVTRTITVLEEVAGVFLESFCLINPFRRWSGGVCREEVTKQIQQTIQIPRSVTIDVPDIDLELGPVLDLVEQPTYMFPAYSMFDQTWSVSEFSTFSGPSVMLLSDGVLAAAIPEPATLAIFGFGLAGLGVIRRRRAV